MCGCFAHVYVCAQFECLVPEETERCLRDLGTGKTDDCELSY